MIMDDEVKKHDISHEGIDTNQTILTDSIFSQPPKLTPTGKVSHAKTRVYTQRYRKEWEQMPDFKGWLTAVPDQVTRAFCIYCKKNLHAHRLSLLKHTCTMKHQRAALLAQNDRNKIRVIKDSNEAFETGAFQEVTVVGSIEGLGPEDDDDNEDFAYVVESLEVEDDEESVHMQEQTDSEEVVMSHEEEVDEPSEKTFSSDEHEQKKIKVEPFSRKDTLAEAMVHVHEDYLDHHEHEGTVGLDMEVVSENTILPDNEEGGVSEGENVKDRSRPQQEAEGRLASPLPENTKIIAYQLNSSDGLRSIPGVTVQGGNTITIATNSSSGKRVTLNPGKTVTLNAAQIGGSTQYVLSKVKGSLPTLMMAGSKIGNYRALAPKVQQQSIAVNRKVVPVSSTATHVLQESSKQEHPRLVEGRNPCISTHVVDTSKGIPVAGLQVSLYKLMDGRWTFLNESTTSGSGRCTDLVDTAETAFTPGRYKMHFDVDKYFTIRRIETLYPFIEIVFDVKNPTGHYHIPVLLSPFGYSTYRGNDR